MIIQLTASAVRARAQRAGVVKALFIRTGRSAERAELEYVAPSECSVLIGSLGQGVKTFVDSLPRRKQS